MDDWVKRRLQELEAAAPTKRKKAEPFVKVPLWWITEATKATKTPRALVCVRLLHASWKAKSLTFSLSSEWLRRRGVSREVWRRALLDLEAAGLITVKRQSGKAPVVTLVLI